MTSPILYGPGFSTYVRSVRLALEEKGVPYQLEEVDLFGGGAATPEHRARHPFAKVPAFEHDGFALYEAGAIMRYVDEAFDGPPLQPDQPRDRARMTQAISILDSYGYPAVIGHIVMQRLVRPLMGESPDEEVIQGALPQARTTLAAIEALLGNNAHLAGGRLSLADLHLVPIYHYLAQTPEGESLLSDTPGLRRWWGGMRSRPSVEKTAPSLG